MKLPFYLNLLDLNLGKDMETTTNEKPCLADRKLVVSPSPTKKFAMLMK